MAINSKRKPEQPSGRPSFYETCVDFKLAVNGELATLEKPSFTGIEIVSRNRFLFWQGADGGPARETEIEKALVSAGLGNLLNQSNLVLEKDGYQALVNYYNERYFLSGYFFDKENSNLERVEYPALRSVPADELFELLRISALNLNGQVSVSSSQKARLILDSVVDLPLTGDRNVDDKMRGDFVRGRMIHTFDEESLDSLENNLFEKAIQARVMGGDANRLSYLALESFIRDSYDLFFPNKSVFGNKVLHFPLRETKDNSVVGIAFDETNCCRTYKAVFKEGQMVDIGFLPKSRLIEVCSGLKDLYLSNKRDLSGKNKLKSPSL